MKPWPLVMLTWVMLLWGALIDANALAGHKDQDERIEVLVDPRVELLSIVFRLAGSPEYMSAPSGPYVAEVEKRFRRYENHEVVKIAKRLRAERGVSFDAVMSMAVHITDALDVDERVSFDLPPEKLDRRWPADSARQFLDALRDFVDVSGFDEFKNDHDEFYEEAASRLREKLSARRYLEWFDKFFGPRGENTTFRAIPGLLEGGGNFGVAVVEEDGSEEINIVIGVSQCDAKGLPVFGAMTSLIVHEFCHSYTNPIVAKHAAELRSAGERIYPHVAEAMKQQAYGDWTTMMYESFVRACVARYVITNDGEAAGQREIEEQNTRSFFWTKEFATLLASYESDRETYLTLDDFVPEIVRFFNDYASRDLVSTKLGPINSVVSHFKRADQMLFVTPDGELQIEFNRWLIETHERFFKADGVERRCASEVLGEDRTKALVLCGSPQTNPILKEAAEKCGFEIASDHIEIGGRRFDGQDLVVITCYPNPFNEDVPVLFYAAARDGLVVNLNRFHHGPTDYVVGRWENGKPVVVSQGNYTKDGTSWALK